MTKPFSYKVEGIGEDFFPSTMNLKIIDEIVRVDDKECFLMTRDSGAARGLCTSAARAGAAVAGAIKYAEMTGKKENILVLLADSAQKYLSKIFNDEWMRENGFLDEQPGLGTVGDLLQSKPSTVVSAKSATRCATSSRPSSRSASASSRWSTTASCAGIVAEVDLLRHLVSGSGTLDRPIGGLVESDYATVTPETKIELLQQVLSDAKLAIVVDDEAVVGLVTKIDLIDFLAKRSIAT